MSELEHESCIEYPCDFPIKAMGRVDSSEDFEALVVSLVRKHADFGEAAVKTRPSKNGNFISVTVTIHATSREQLDNIYLELTGRDEVLMAL